MADLTRTVAVDVDEEPQRPSERFTWPWQLVAILGPLAVVLAGWIILAGVSTIVWIQLSEVSFRSALVIATQLFSLTHGASIELVGQTVTLMPLGLSALLMFLGLPVAGAAARLAAERFGEFDETGALNVDLERVVWWTGGVYAVTYAAAVAIVSGAVLGWDVAPRTLLGALLIGAVSGLWGASRGVGWDGTQHWPAWCRSIPRAMGVAVLTVLAAGSAALTVAMVLGRQRIETITASLEPDWAGFVALIVLHLIYLPNLVLWACSWILGAGVSLGDGSLISLAVTDVGLMPAIPGLGAVPEPGVGSLTSFWWLAAGVVAGVLAALAVTWSRPRARFDETALVGGLSGVVAGLILTLLASVASGGLGSDRLVHMGARVGQLAVFAPTLLGLSGLAAGLVLGLLRRPPRQADADEGGEERDEEDDR